MNSAETGAKPKKIVVGLDGSQRSIEALRRAAALADALGARIELVAAWQYPSVASGGYPPDVMLFESWARDAIVEARGKVWGANPPETLSMLVREGSPARVLIEESRDADMLVVGSRGHGGFAGLLLGSVSMVVAEHATCSVLVVHDVPTGHVAAARPAAAAATHA